MNELSELQAWYETQCNGDWEHTWGVHIETLDNPGWRLRIDLAETELAGRPFHRLELENSEREWMHCWVEDATFGAAGGPGMLSPMLRVFLDWAARANTEIHFREAERRLDELLRRDEAMIQAQGINMSDASARFYHYKNELLSWAFHFETRKQRGSETQTVRVVVSMSETNTAEIRVWTRAELFQLGKPSRWEFTTEQLIGLAHTEDVGLGTIVLSAIKVGQAAADAAP